MTEYNTTRSAIYGKDGDESIKITFSGFQDLEMKWLRDVSLQILRQKIKMSLIQKSTLL